MRNETFKHSSKKFTHVRTKYLRNKSMFYVLVIYVVNDFTEIIGPPGDLM